MMGKGGFLHQNYAKLKTILYSLGATLLRRVRLSAISPRAANKRRCGLTATILGARANWQSSGLFIKLSKYQIPSSSHSIGLFFNFSGRCVTLSGFYLYKTYSYLWLLGTLFMRMEGILASKGHCLCRKSHCLCRKGHCLRRKGHCLCRKGHCLCRKGHCLCRKGHYLFRIGHCLCRKGHSPRGKGRYLFGAAKHPAHRGYFPGVQAGIIQ